MSDITYEFGDPEDDRGQVVAQEENSGFHDEKGIDDHLYECFQ
jgi:hypothetical protein